MKTFSIWAMAVLLVACSTGKAPESSKHFKKIKTYNPLPGLEIHEYQHTDNGLHVYLSQKKGSDSVAYVTGYDVGSRFETPGRTGLAHLFEHMMFRGTESYPYPFKTLSEWGGRYNAYTSNDMTVYHELVPEKHLEDVIHFESERMRKLLITKEGYNTERGAVVSERKQSIDDNPFGRLYWELYDTAFDKHSYKVPPIGKQKDLDAASFEDALNFYKRFYAPNRANISIVGDFEFKEALKLMDTYYGPFKAQEMQLPNIPKEPLQRKMRRKVVSMKTQKVIMADAVFGLPANHAEAPAELLLCVLLGASEIGYLSYELVEKGLAASVSTDCYPNYDPGLSTVYVEANPGTTVERLEGAYLNTRKGFLNWLTQDKIDSIKLYFVSSQWAPLRNPMNLAKKLASSKILNGDPTHSFKFMDDVQKVTREDIIKRWNAWSQLGKTRVFVKPQA